MKMSDITYVLNKIEKEFPVDEWTINDIHIWPLLRFDLMMNLRYSDYPNYQTTLSLAFKLNEIKKMLFGLTTYLKAYFLDYKNNQKITKVDTLFLSTGLDRNLINDKFYEIFYDPFTKVLRKNNISSLTLEFSHRYRVPRHNKSIFIQPYLDFYLIKHLLFVKSKYKENLPCYKEFVSHVNKIAGTTIPLPTVERLRSVFSVITAYEEYYLKVLAKAKPKMVFVISYYGPRDLALLLACKKLSIPTVDIQHGRQGEFHQAYGRWKNIPNSGYEFIPSIFWCWSEFEKKIIDKWAKNTPHKAIVGGNQYLELWLENKANFVKDYSKKIQSLKRNNIKYNILFTLSVGNESEEEFRDILQIMKDSPQDWQWWVRLHPRMFDKEKIRKMFVEKGITNFELDNATSLPLHAILKQIDIHVTHESSCIIEAAAFGIPTVAMSKHAESFFGDFFKEKVVKGGYTKKTLQANIEYFLYNKHKQKKNIHKFIFEKKFLELIKKTI